MSHYKEIQCKIKSRNRKTIEREIAQFAQEMGWTRITRPLEEGKINLRNYRNEPSGIFTDLAYKPSQSFFNEVGFDFDGEYMRIESDLSDDTLNRLKFQIARTLVLEEAKKSGLSLTEELNHREGATLKFVAINSL